MPQGSVLRPLLLNIYINDLFFLTAKTNVCKYVDDTTFYACDSLFNLKIEHDSVLAIEWFECNYMKLNQDKRHLRGINMKVCGQMLVLAKFELSRTSWSQH